MIGLIEVCSKVELVPFSVKCSSALGEMYFLPKEEIVKYVK